MTTRTFVQYGQGFGPEPVSITAKIDGNVVFNGTVSTVDSGFPGFAQEYPGVLLFSWSRDLENLEPMQLEITVNSGNALWLGKTLANYVIRLIKEDPPAVFGDSGPDDFEEFYRWVDVDGDIVADPLFDVKVDGIARSVDRNSFEPNYKFNGQWPYVINTGETLTATIRVSDKIVEV